MTPQIYLTMKLWYPPCIRIRISFCGQETTKKFSEKICWTKISDGAMKEKRSQIGWRASSEVCIEQKWIVSMNYFQETSISYCQVQTIDALGIAFLSLSLFPPIHMSFLFKMDKASQKRSSHELFLAKKYSYPFSPSVLLLSLQDKLLCDINAVEC